MFSTIPRHGDEVHTLNDVSSGPKYFESIPECLIVTLTDLISFVSALCCSMVQGCDGNKLVCTAPNLQ